MALTLSIAPIVLTARAATELAGLCLRDRGLPLWDEAAHGWAGVEVAQALRHVNPIELFLAINRQVLWPFVHSLLLAPLFLAFGDEPLVARLASVGFFAAGVLGLAGAGQRLHPARGVWVGLVAAALSLLAPAWRLYGSLAMLEMPGALLLVAALAFYALARAESTGGPLLLACGICSAALFLCKYNYGLLWLVPLVLHEWRAGPAPLKAAAGAQAWRWVTRRAWLRPMPMVVLLGGVAIGAILLSGGGMVQLWGRRISLKSPGNLAYALLVLVVVWALVPFGVRRAQWGRLWSLLPGRHRVLIASIGLPLAVWFLMPYPNRVKEFFGFVMNRDSRVSPWSLQWLLYYPRAFAEGYAPTAAVGWTVLALALIPPRVGEPRHPARLVALAVWIGLAATLLHRYRDPRFLFTVAPLLWLAAARNLVAGLEALVARLPRGREAAWATLGAGLVTAALVAEPPAARWREPRAALSTSADLAPALDHVLEAAAAASGRSWLLGYANPLSPSLLAWRAHLARPALPRSRLPGRLPWLPPDASEQAIAERVAMLRTSGLRIIAALPTAVLAARLPAYAEEVRGDSATAARLAQDPAVALVSDERLEPLGMRVRVFRPR